MSQKTSETRQGKLPCVCPKSQKCHSVTFCLYTKRGNFFIRAHVWNIMFYWKEVIITILFKLEKKLKWAFQTFLILQITEKILEFCMPLDQQHTNLLKCQSLAKPHQKSVTTAVSSQIPEDSFSSRGHCMTSGGHKAAWPERGTTETAAWALAETTPYQPSSKCAETPALRCLLQLYILPRNNPALTSASV